MTSYNTIQEKLGIGRKPKDLGFNFETELDLSDFGIPLLKHPDVRPGNSHVASDTNSQNKPG